MIKLIAAIGLAIALTGCDAKSHHGQNGYPSFGSYDLGPYDGLPQGEYSGESVHPRNSEHEQLA